MRAINQSFCDKVPSNLSLKGERLMHHPKEFKAKSLMGQLGI